MAVRFIVITTALVAVSTMGIAGGRPGIQFGNMALNVGKVYYGDKVDLQFEYTNTGDAPLVVARVRSSCGCTKAHADTKEVPPGGKGRIVLTYDTHGQSPGVHEKMVMVFSNDPDKPAVVLQVHVDVVRDLEVSPSSLAKRLKKFEPEIPMSFKLTNHSNKAVILSGVKAFGAAAKVDMRPDNVRVEPKSTGEVGLVLRLENTSGLRSFMGRIVVGTDHPRETDIRLEYLVLVDDKEAHLQ